MTTLLRAATPTFPIAGRLKALAFEVGSLAAALLDPRRVIAEVEAWRAQMLQAERAAARRQSGSAA